VLANRRVEPQAALLERSLAAFRRDLTWSEGKTHFSNSICFQIQFYFI